MRAVEGKCQINLQQVSRIVFELLYELLPSSLPELVMSIQGFCQGYLLVGTVHFGFVMTSFIASPWLTGEKPGVLTNAFTTVVAVFILVSTHLALLVVSSEFWIPNGEVAARRTALGWFVVGIAMSLILPRLDAVLWKSRE